MIQTSSRPAFRSLALALALAGVPTGCGSGATGSDGGSPPADGAVLPTGCNARGATLLEPVAGMPPICMDGFCTVAPWGLPGLSRVQVVGADEVWATVYLDGIAHGARMTWTVERIPDLSQVHALYAAGPGDVWAGGVGGLYHREGRVWRHVTDVGGIVSAIAGRRGSRDLWAIAGHTLHHFDGAAWSTISLPERRGYGVLTVSPMGDVFLAGTAGVGRVVSGSIQQIPGPDGEPITELFATGPYDVWAGWLNDFGQWHYDGAGWTKVRIEDPSVAVTGIYAAWGSRRDDIWLPWSGGMAHWNGTTCSEIWKVPEGNAWPTLRYVHGCVDGSVVYATGEGLAWREGGAWTVRRNAASRIKDLAVASDGAAWLAFSGRMVGRLSGDTLTTTTVPGFPSVVTTAGTDAFVAGQELVRVRADGAVDVLVPAGSDFYRDVYASGPGDVWLVTSMGQVRRWTPSGGLDSLSAGVTAKLTAVSGSGPDDVWFVGERSAMGGTAVHWNGSAFEPVAGLPYANIVSVAARTPDDVWIALNESRPLMHWDGTTWTRLDAAVGPGTLTPDGPGAVWIAGPRGVARVSLDGSVEQPAIGSGEAIAVSATAVYVVDAAGGLLRRRRP